jgi:hypothetical protein
MPDFRALTQVQKAIWVWDAGDFPAVARCSRRPRPRWSTGWTAPPITTTSTSRPAAATPRSSALRRGARTTGLDVVPELIDAARQRRAEEGLDVELLVGDAQDLPFADDGFDPVSSVFGAMFAPDHPRAAAELMRVCRPSAA